MWNPKQDIYICKYESFLCAITCVLPISMMITALLPRLDALLPKCPVVTRPVVVSRKKFRSKMFGDSTTQ